MTVDTQKLRELLEKATPGPWHAGTDCPGRCCWHIFTGLPIYGAPQYEGDDGQPVVMNECSQDDAALMVAARNALPALLAEIDALRAELQARQWQPIESCPRQHGRHYLICKDCGPGTLPSISIGYCFDDQKDWHLVESNCTAEMYGYRVTHWQPLPLPPAPPQGDGA